MARGAGLLVGLRSAAVLHVAFERALKMDGGDTMVAILPGSGIKYLSIDMFADEEKAAVQKSEIPQSATSKPIELLK